MKNLIRAIAKLPGGRLRLLIRAGRLDAKVQRLEARLAKVRKEETRLERRLAAAGQKLESLLGGAARRGPGRPPKYRGPGRPPKRRGPGRPPGRRGPGRPPSSGRRVGRARVNDRPLAIVLKDVLGKKSQPMSVGELAAQARASGYKTKSKPEVFAITVSLALRKRTDLFTRNGRKYQLAKAAEATS
jgi:hypothetical protein